MAEEKPVSWVPSKKMRVETLIGLRSLVTEYAAGWMLAPPGGKVKSLYGTKKVAYVADVDDLRRRPPGPGDHETRGTPSLDAEYLRVQSF